MWPTVSRHRGEISVYGAIRVPGYLDRLRVRQRCDSGSSVFTIVDDTPIVLPSGQTLEISTVLDAVDAANVKFVAIAETTSTIAFNIFKVLDFRMLSGMVGESFVSTMA